MEIGYKMKKSVWDEVDFWGSWKLEKIRGEEREKIDIYRRQMEAPIFLKVRTKIKRITIFHKNFARIFDSVPRTDNFILRQNFKMDSE